MRVQLHGGRCCGIKHIYGLESYPNMNIAARPALPEKKTSFRPYLGGHNDMRKTFQDFFCEAAPKETYAERFKRIVAFIKAKRTTSFGGGVIEVVVTNYQETRWKPIFEAEGFKLVSSFKNGNTGSQVRVWHLVH